MCVCAGTIVKPILFVYSSLKWERLYKILRNSPGLRVMLLIVGHLLCHLNARAFYSTYSAKIKFFHPYAISDTNYTKFNHLWRHHMFNLSETIYKSWSTLGVQDRMNKSVRLNSLPQRLFVLVGWSNDRNLIKAEVHRFLLARRWAKWHSGIRYWEEGIDLGNEVGFWGAIYVGWTEMQGNI